MRDTSLEAYASVQPVLPAMESMVLDFVQSRGRTGATLHEIAEGTALLLQSVCGSRLKLEQKGRIIDAGITRLSPSGRKAKVWVAV